MDFEWPPRALDSRDAAISINIVSAPLLRITSLALRFLPIVNRACPFGVLPFTRHSPLLDWNKLQVRVESGYHLTFR